MGLHSNKKVGYPNLTKKEKQTAYCLKDSGTVMWDIQDYLAEVRPPLEDKEVYQDLTENAEGLLMKIIKSILRKERNRKYISDEV